MDAESETTVGIKPYYEPLGERGHLVRVVRVTRTGNVVLGGAELLRFAFKTDKTGDALRREAEREASRRLALSDAE